MTSWTSPITWTTSDGTAAQFNQQLRDNLLNLDERMALHGLLSSTRRSPVKGALVGVFLTASGTQSIASATDVAVSWDVEAYDTDGFHDAGQPARITIPSGLDGYYLVTAKATDDSGLNDDSRVWVEDDAGSILARQWCRIGATRQLACVVSLAAAEWIVVRVRHESGLSETLNKDADGCGFGAWRLFAS